MGTVLICASLSVAKSVDYQKLRPQITSDYAVQVEQTIVSYDAVEIYIIKKIETQKPLCLPETSPKDIIVFDDHPEGYGLVYLYNINSSSNILQGLGILTNKWEMPVTSEIYKPPMGA